MLPAEKRTWKIITIALLIAGAIFGFSQCGDSSWYTFNGEKANRQIILPIAIAAVIGVAIWAYIANKKPKKK